LLYFAILLCFAFGLDDSALADSVGRVSKVQNQAQVGSIPAAVGTSVVWVIPSGQAPMPA
jgi:hypothetical protein